MKKSKFDWINLCIECEQVRTVTGRCSGCNRLVGWCTCTPIQKKLEATEGLKIGQ